MKLSYFNLKKYSFLLLIALLSLNMLSVTSCKVKEGCPTKSFTNNMEKTTKHGKYNLFPKDMRKKMKKK